MKTTKTPHILTPKFFRMIDALAARWSDEHEFEDINTYAAPLQKLLPTGARITRMTRRPFGFKGTHPAGAFTVKVTARAVEVDWHAPVSDIRNR
jgi:hypothetical protein